MTRSTRGSFAMTSLLYDFNQKMIERHVRWRAREHGPARACHRHADPFTGRRCTRCLAKRATLIPTKAARKVL